MKRRDFLSWTAATTALAALGGEARAIDPRRERRPLPSGKRLLFVFAQGGWDTSYALDPKTPAQADVPAGALQRFGDLEIFTDASRPNVTDYFARYGDVSAVVRGVLVGSVAHPECQKRMATGTRSEKNPDLAAIVGHDLGASLPLPYLILGDLAWVGAYAASAGRVGMRNQLVTLLDQSQAYPTGGKAPFWSDAAEDAALARYAEASAARLRAQRGAMGYNRKRVDDFVESLARSSSLVAARAGFGKQGRTLAIDDQIDFALDALSSDLSQAVMLNTRFDFDTHTQNEDQAALHEQTFAALSKIVGALQTRPGRSTGKKMIDDTIVVCLSEFSRTPRLNARKGKDHWPVGAAVIAGGGIRGGRTYGATTDAVQAELIDYATGAASPSGQILGSAQLGAGILRACGVDPSLHLPITPFEAFLA